MSKNKYIKCSNCKLNSPVEFRCKNCGEKLISDEQIEMLYQLALYLSNGKSNALKDGQFINADNELNQAKKAKSECPNNQKFSMDKNDKRMKSDELLKILEASGIKDIITLLDEPIKERIGLKHFSNEYNENNDIYLNQTIDKSDIKKIQNTLNFSKNLDYLISKYDKKNRTSVSALIKAIKLYSFGSDPLKSKFIFGKLLEIELDPFVKAFILYHYAKTLTYTNPKGALVGIKKLDEALRLCPNDNIEMRLMILRQALVHSYICVEKDDVLNPEEWFNMQNYLDESIDILGIKNEDNLKIKLIKASNVKISKIPKFNKTIGLGILMFEAFKNAAFNYDNKRDNLRYLHWHLDLIKVFQKNDAVNGWNRYTPLAAQAISLGQLDFAKQVINLAYNYVKFPDNSIISSYANKQKENRGTDWLFFLVVKAAYHIAKSKDYSNPKDRIAQIELAKSALKNPLDPNNSNKSLLFIRAAKLYNKEIIAEKNKMKRIETVTGAMNPPANTHWTYLPNVPNLFVD
jgi:hypothetical protein